MTKIGRNDPCPCGKKKEDGSFVKYKDCHKPVVETANSVVLRNDNRVKAKLRQVFNKMGLKNADVDIRYDSTGHILTYYLNNQKALKVDYTGIPMDMKTLENIEKIAKVDIDSIPIEVF